MARKIVLTSGKGGVGKTTVCANLGGKLASLGFRVVLLDVDIGLNNLDVVMGIEDRIMFDIIDVIESKCRVKQALVQDPILPSLYVLPSAHSYHKSKIAGEHIKSVVDMLDSGFDYILIDCPAGVEAGFHRACYSANEAIVVVTPHISSIRDADKVLSLLSNYRLTAKGLVINRLRGDLMISGDMMDVESIVRALKIPLLGVIPEDDNIGTLSSIGGMVKNAESSRAFTILSENIHNGSKKVFDCTLKYRGLFGTIRRNLKRKV